jgi:hypothetical protein
MDKNTFKNTCDYFGINKKALKEYLKKHGLKAKHATEKEVLEVIWLNAPDLMYSRSEGDGGVEYYDKSVPIRLADALSKAKMI